MSRIEARDIAFKFIFEDLFHTPEDSTSYEDFLNNNDMSAEDISYIRDIYTGVLDKWDELLGIIKENCTGYTIDRIYRVDLAILMLATYELKYTTTDQKVVINEAIKLSKKYSTDKSYSFCNGVLSKIVKGL